MLTILTETFTVTVVLEDNGVNDYSNALLQRCADDDDDVDLNW